MTETTQQTHITILIDEKPYHVDKRAMTGAEIKALASIPRENRLFREVPGPGDDIFIPDDETVELKSGEQFYDLPRGVHGAPTLQERISSEVAHIEQEFGRCEARPQSDGSVVLAIGPVALPAGWSMQSSRIVIVVPPGYREERPKGFFAEPGLTLAGGGTPNTASQTAVAGEPVTYFCWQPANWDPARDGLWKYTKLMAERFAEAA
jgi:hypothetical protein